MKGGVVFILAVVLLLLPAPFNGGLFPEPGRRVAYNAGLHKGCFYKVGQFQLCRDSLTLLTHRL